MKWPPCRAGQGDLTDVAFDVRYLIRKDLRSPGGIQDAGRRGRDGGHEGRPRPGALLLTAGRPGRVPPNLWAANKITQSVINVREADYDVRKPNRKTPLGERCLARGAARRSDANFQD